MTYIGNNLTVQQYSPQIAYFSGNGTATSFTLPVSVVSAAQIIVSVANVVQNPSSAFTVSGTTLTFTSAPPSGTNNIWVEYTSLQTNTIAPSQGTVQNSSFGAVTAIPMTYGTIGAGDASMLKNRIINGAMVIDQRNAGASVTVGSGNPLYNTVDRWYLQTTQASKFSIQQNAGSVTPPAGFKNYVGVTSLSAYSVGASDYFNIGQWIEGYNIADLGFGTANAKTVTLSFWIYSSLTGTFGGCLGTTQFYPFSYSIPVANTWTQISITLAGSTSGSWNSTNGQGLLVLFSLGTGSSLSGTANTWTNSATLSTTGATSVVGTNGATFYITGVQLEVGNSATGYEYRQYGQELALCQRYYAKMTAGSGAYTAFGSGRGGGGTNAFCFIKYPTSMRSGPTIAISNIGVNTPSQVTATGINSTYAGLDSAGFEVATGATTISSGTAVILNANANSAGYIELTSEL